MPSEGAAVGRPFCRRSGNAGTVAAADVRIATYLIEHGNDAAIAALLANPPAADGEPATIAAGEGLRVEAVLALPRATLPGAFQPVVVADARYRLADGSEGRTSAAFEIGLTGAEGRVIGDQQVLDLDAVQQGGLGRHVGLGHGVRRGGHGERGAGGRHLELFH